MSCRDVRAAWESLADDYRGLAFDASSPDGASWLMLPLGASGTTVRVDFAHIAGDAMCLLTLWRAGNRIRWREYCHLGVGVCVVRDEDALRCEFSRLLCAFLQPNQSTFCGVCSTETISRLTGKLMPATRIILDKTSPNIRTTQKYTVPERRYWCATCKHMRSRVIE